MVAVDYRSRVAEPAVEVLVGAEAELVGAEAGLALLERHHAAPEQQGYVGVGYSGYYQAAEGEILTLQIGYPPAQARNHPATGHIGQLDKVIGLLLGQCHVGTQAHTRSVGHCAHIPYALHHRMVAADHVAEPVDALPVGVVPVERGVLVGDLPVLPLEYGRHPLARDAQPRQLMLRDEPVNHQS